jgi:uncharacterized Fe-S cluster-containing radical SAM superfamily protein
MMSNKGRELRINRLRSGGLITNYFCTSRCGHCLYRCSPRREREYIDEETTRKNFEKIKSLGCHSIHIGGGEPFLDLAGLKRVIEIAHEMRVDVEYVETNSSWYKNKESACAVLRELSSAGLSSLLVSMSPFHNEFIPFSKVKGASEACLVTGVSAFPWIKDFYREIDSFDNSIPHKMSEYQGKFGDDYLEKIPSRYWIHFGGRALTTFQKVLHTTDYRAILSSNKRGCSELLDVSHFHLDLFGNYIPGLCSGLAIRRDDLGKPVEPEEYPFLSILFEFGINGLFDVAVKDYGFEPSEKYLSKCHLCSEIRRHLVIEKELETRELQPRGYYENP